MALKKHLSLKCTATRPVAVPAIAPATGLAPTVEESPPPIFVGGTGRSGTTILASLLGTQREYKEIPVEAKFHAVPAGLPAVLRGADTPATLAERMRERWWNSAPDRPTLARLVDRECFDAARARFVERAAEDPVAAGRHLMQDLFGSFAQREGKRGWVEMTPSNAVYAPVLARLLPELRFVLTVRDGRDVASSMVALGWSPNFQRALRRWELVAIRGKMMCELLPAGALHVVRFEQLFVENREASYKALLRFLGWRDEPKMRRFFEERMTPERAHVGRWEADFTAAERESITAEYTAMQERLTAAPAWWGM